jgi:hypothetical protein
MILITCDQVNCPHCCYPNEKNPKWITIKDFMREYHFCSWDCARILINGGGVQIAEIELEGRLIDGEQS